MRPLLLMLCLLLASGIAHAQKVYKVVQPDGTILFTDSPPPGEDAEPVDVAPLNTTPGLASARDAFDDTPAVEHEKQYTRFRITSPENDSSFWETAGNVNVDLSLEPPLRSGDKIDVMLDGQTVGSGRATAITLTGMNRGTHNVQAVVRDSAGNVVARSNAVTFTVQKGSQLSPQRRPTLIGPARP